LGWHYGPIDYAVTHLFVTNATIDIAAGTVFAVFNSTNSTYYGFALGTGAKINCNGQADAKVTVTSYGTVQEMANSDWAGPIDSLFIRWHTYTVGPELRCDFTDISVMGATRWFYGSYVTTPSRLSLRNCQLRGGTLRSTAVSIAVTNSLFDRSYTYLEEYAATDEAHFHNCTFSGGTFEFFWYDTNVVSFTDNLFANSATILDWGDVPIPSSAIGYTTNCVNRLSANTNDVTVNSLTFQTGLLGRFYLPTNAAFINTGSRYATNAGLYHFTTTTNNVKEGITKVDIGFHPIATDANGKALDTDGDGTSDYAEDKNGNGTCESTAGETDWQAYNSSNGLSTSPGLKVFTPLK
jgi:hypothetical protein